MFNPLAFANAAPAAVATLETVAVGGASDERALAVLPFVPLQRTTVNGRWEGPLASITLTHTYAYTRAQCDRVLEAIYRFPLPGDAAVRRVVVTFGEVEIVAELRERHAAEQAYEEAKRLGQQAALTTRESADVFTLRVAGLQPDQDVVVETTCVLLATPAGGDGWLLRIPLTTAPRYVRADERNRGHRSADAQPLAVYRDPGHRFALDIITANGHITSGTHALRASDEDGHIRVRLQQGELLPDRDCVLTWRPERSHAERASLHAIAGSDAGSTSTFFMALVSPPVVAVDPALAPPREAIVLVDHSGSMSGAKWQAADRAALGFIADLTPRDRFNLGVFDNSTRWLSGDPVPAGTDAVARAERFLSAESDGGGTELGVALEQALTQKVWAGDVSRQIVIITDAQVTDDGRILNMVESYAGRANRRRVSVLCIDAAPNAHLTQELAALGGGLARFLTSQSGNGSLAAEEMTAALRDILDGWSQPVAVGLKLAVNREGLEVSSTSALAPTTGTDARWSTVELGDLTMGRSLWVAGRIPGGLSSGDGADLTFRLTGAGLEPVEVQVAFGAAPSGAPPAGAPPAMGGALKALFGAYRVQGLERIVAEYGRVDVPVALRRLGYDPERLLAHGSSDTTGSVYPENDERALQESVSALLLREALEYGLLCSVTGFVAVRKEQGLPVEDTTLIGNALPEGWEEQGFLSARAAPNLGWDLRSMSMLAAPSALRSSVAPRAKVSDAMMRPAFRRESAPAPTPAMRYVGRPVTGAQGVATLFDTSRPEDAGAAAAGGASGELRWLEVHYRAGAPDARSVLARLALVIEVDGQAGPPSRLADIARRGGRIRIAVSYRPGQRLCLLLLDPDGVWASVAPEIVVTLE